MLRYLLVLLSAFAMAGCASMLPNGEGHKAFEEGRALVEAGNPEQGLARVMEAAKLEPGNLEYRTYYFRQRDEAVQRYVLLGDHARRAQQLDLAEQAYRRALGLDPTHARASDSLEFLAVDRRHQALLLDAEALLKQGNKDAAHARIKEILVQNPGHREAQALLRRIEERAIKAAAAAPQLGAALRKPVTLEFRDAPLRSVFEIISKQSGLNFLFDRDVPADLKTTVFVKNTTIEDAIRFVLVTNQLERKILNETTLLIYPNTPAKNRDYREHVIRSFYLANADVKQTANMIKALIRTRDLFVDEKLNLLVMRDTPEAVRMAERLVANQDLGEPEVMLEVEVLEVGTNLLSQLGIQWPSQLDVGIIGKAGVPGTINLSERHMGSGLWRLTFDDPLFILSLRKQDGRTNVLANPRIRVKNREKARIHIGDKVPVITTTTTATGFVAESVTYLDIGLKLEVEPQIFLENDVAIRVGLEVSNIAREIVSRAGTVTYQVGTRNAATMLRLKDGETQVLAGLINDEDRRSASKVPGLGDMPGIGRLFQRTNDTHNKTEIVLLITPRVVRNLARSDGRVEEFPAGTDAAIGAEPMTLPQGAPFAGMGGAAPAGSVPGSTPGSLPGAGSSAVPGTIPAPSPVPGPGSSSVPPPRPATFPTPGAR